ncbi:BRCT domain-containing protein [Fimicolochytrium jonesii]|uniref:BRCT domain-containing protein n=1 Tax=Fimicolochytrium jonesii TaxID=1396493 RepID=UPI0022FE844D|nr:BRCT domain-containing protein [Fimicolochytrium jonesii]KAI8818711.1 BRCT domain-containing protein [Fimicolochytrium jonesii]
MLQEVTSVQFTVGKVDAGVAMLLSPHHHLLEFPSQILPDGIKTGSIVNFTIERNFDEERRQQEDFLSLQEEIYLSFSQPPKEPILSLKSITQTSAIIHWEPLVLHAADLRGIDVYRNGQRLNITVAPNATSAKLSGLDVNHEYEVWIDVRTSAGVLQSNKIRITTHAMENLTGINVSFGTFTNPHDIEPLMDLLGRMGANFTDELTTDNTHLVSTVPRGPKYEKAVEWNIPIVSPEFLKACHAQGKIQPATAFYVNNPNPPKTSVDK